MKESGNTIHDFSPQNCGGPKKQESPFTTSYLKNFGGPKWRKQETPFARSRFKVFDAQSEGNRTLNSLFWYSSPMPKAQTLHMKSQACAHDLWLKRSGFLLKQSCKACWYISKIILFIEKRFNRIFETFQKCFHLSIYWIFSEGVLWEDCGNDWKM